MSVMTAADWRALLTALANRLAAQADALNRLDMALGDGDHGSGISAAFAAAVAGMDALEQPSMGDIWMQAARALLNRGGASGALFGTFFLRGAGIMKDAKGLGKADMDEILQAALAGVKQRGKAEAGDKTMVDALEPAVKAFCASASYDDAWRAAAQAARQGAASTAGMLARHGRAKFIGERSLGHQDAGAVAVALIFETVQEYWEGKNHGKA